MMRPLQLCAPLLGLTLLATAAAAQEQAGAPSLEDAHVVFLGEVVGLAQFLGTALLLGGVWLADRSARPPRTVRATPGGGPARGSTSI